MAQTGPDWEQIAAGFARPFAPEEIGLRPGHGKEQYQYIEARSVMDRLDEVAGVAAWSAAYRVVDVALQAVECALTVHGITKTDVGYPNGPKDAEPLKAAYSDAIKRAAVQWGIGRHLYPKASGVARLEPAEPNGNGKGRATVVDLRGQTRTVQESRNEALDRMWATLREKGIQLRTACDHLDIRKDNTGDLTIKEIERVRDWAAEQKATTAREF